MTKDAGKQRGHARYVWWAAAIVSVGVVALAVLIRRPSEPEPITTTATSAAKPIPVQARSASPMRDHAPVASTAPTDDETSEPAMRGPAAGVWKALGRPHATAFEERAALLSAFQAAPACDGNWCVKGRETLDAWVAAVSAKADGLTADRVTCSAAGCWLTVKLTNPSRWRDAAEALRNVALDQGWPGPTIRGAPEFQQQHGAVVALWAVLPFEETTAKGEQE